MSSIASSIVAQGTVEILIGKKGPAGDCSDCSHLARLLLVWFRHLQELNLSIILAGYPSMFCTCSICLSISLPICLYSSNLIHPSIQLSRSSNIYICVFYIYISIHLYLFISRPLTYISSACMQMHLSICLYILQSVYMSIIMMHMGDHVCRLPLCPLFTLPIDLSIYLSICASSLFYYLKPIHLSAFVLYILFI